MTLWNHRNSSNFNLKRSRTLEKQLRLTESFLGQVPLPTSYSDWNRLMKGVGMIQNLSTSRRMELFLIFRGLHQYYQDPVRRLALMDEMLRHMGDFRIQTSGLEAFKRFESRLKEDPLGVLKLFQFQFEEMDEEIAAFIKPHPLMKWNVYFNPRHFCGVFRLGSLSEVASYVEYLLIHEWVHLIQFQLELDLAFMKEESESKDWQACWCEREAMYVAERVYQSLLYPKQFSMRVARQVVQEIAYPPLTTQVLLFKEQILIPYHDSLKAKQQNGFFTKLRSFKLSI